MDNEPNPSENESEVVESNESINENGCDDAKDTEHETVNEINDKDGANQPSEFPESEKKDDDEMKCLSPKQASPADEPATESDQYVASESDNPSDISPEKEPNIANEIITSPSEMESEEPTNEKDWNQVIDSSPEKSRSDVACVISSPSEPECDDLANDKSWGQLNESIGESENAFAEDSMDDEPESDDDVDNEFIERSSPKMEAKSNVDCPVFELTDDNSSVDARSEAEDDIEADDMGEEEEESDYSESIHNIDDSDDEPYVEEGINQNTRQMPSSHSAKIDMKQPMKSQYESEQTFDEDAKLHGKYASARISSLSRNYIKTELQKQSASKLHRYLAVKRSIKCLSICHLMPRRLNKNWFCRISEDYSMSKRVIFFCKPHLMPLKSITLEKLERMQKQAIAQLKETRATTAAAAAPEQ